jgi:hypothetical protein
LVICSYDGSLTPALRFADGSPRLAGSDREVSRVARHQGHSHLHSAQVRGHGGEVGDRLERVVIQEDQVTSVAGGNRALAPE